MSWLGFSVCPQHSKLQKVGVCRRGTWQTSAAHSAACWTVARVPQA